MLSARIDMDMAKNSGAMRGGGFRRVILGLVAILIALGIGLGITRILEWGAGWRLYASHRNAGLIWGRDCAVRKSSARRVLAIGDSFTYGWGVDGEDSWPKVMERALRRGGLDIEGANLGAPGGGPRERS